MEPKFKHKIEKRNEMKWFGNGWNQTTLKQKRCNQKNPLILISHKNIKNKNFHSLSFNKNQSTTSSSSHKKEKDQREWFPTHSIKEKRNFSTKQSNCNVKGNVIISLCSNPFFF